MGNGSSGRGRSEAPGNHDQSSAADPLAYSRAIRAPHGRGRMLVGETARPRSSRCRREPSQLGCALTSYGLICRGTPVQDRFSGSRGFAGEPLGISLGPPLPGVGPLGSWTALGEDLNLPDAASRGNPIVLGGILLVSASVPPFLDSSDPACRSPMLTRTRPLSRSQRLARVLD